MYQNIAGHCVYILIYIKHLFRHIIPSKFLNIITFFFFFFKCNEYSLFSPHLNNQRKQSLKKIFSFPSYKCNSSQNIILREKNIILIDKEKNVCEIANEREKLTEV